MTIFLSKSVKLALEVFLGYSYDLAYFHPDILIEAILIKKRVSCKDSYISFLNISGGMFLPATSAAVPVIQSLVTYGGLVVFGGFMLYDTQKIIKKAELANYSGKKYDPINA